MPAEKLVPDADPEDRHVDGIDPLGDGAEGGIAPFQAERAAREDDPVRRELGPRRRVRNDRGLDVQVAEDAPLSVGPLTSVVDDEDPQGSSSFSAVCTEGSGFDPRRSSSTAAFTSERSVRMRSISSSNGVKPDGERIRAEM